DGTPTGADRVRASIKLLDGAIKRLGRRDRGGIRAELHAQRDALAGALAAFVALGADLEGPRAIELIERLTQARAARDAAESAFNAAGRDEVAARRADLDAAEADLRAVHRDIAAALEAARFPRLPDERAFKAAEASTAHLSHWIPRNRPA